MCQSVQRGSRGRCRRAPGASPWSCDLLGGRTRVVPLAERLPAPAWPAAAAGTGHVEQDTRAGPGIQSAGRPASSAPAPTSASAPQTEEQRQKGGAHILLVGLLFANVGARRSERSAAGDKRRRRPFPRVLRAPRGGPLCPRSRLRGQMARCPLSRRSH